MAVESKAKCLLCNAEFSKAGMSKHLKSCLTKQSALPEDSEKPAKKTSAKPFFHIVAEGLEQPWYWMHLKVSADAALKDLDKFLRDTWLECCGHLSAFTSPKGEVSMSKKLKDFKPGTELVHEYDFGTPTVLKIRIMDQYTGTAEKKKVRILARNEAPQIPCSECGKTPAVKVCAECIWDNAGWLCKACVKKHECDEEMLLPVVNSPRTGMCGYEG